GLHHVYGRFFEKQESHRRALEKRSPDLVPPGGQGATSSFFQRIEEQCIPFLTNCFNTGGGDTVVGKFNFAPAHDFNQSVISVFCAGLGVHDLAISQINGADVGTRNHLQGAAAAGEAAHLQDIKNVKKI